MSANFAAATTKGATAASNSGGKTCHLLRHTEWANVIPFVLLEKITLDRRYPRTWFLDELSFLLGRAQLSKKDGSIVNVPLVE